MNGAPFTHVVEHSEGEMGRDRGCHIAPNLELYFDKKKYLLSLHQTIKMQLYYFKKNSAFVILAILSKIANDGLCWLLDVRKFKPHVQYCNFFLRWGHQSIELQKCIAGNFLQANLFLALEKLNVI